MGIIFDDENGPASKTFKAEPDQLGCSALVLGNSSANCTENLELENVDVQSTDSTDSDHEPG